MSVYDPNSGYLRDILDQPAALVSTGQELEKGLLLNDLPNRLAKGEFKTVVLTGMGSSYHALQLLFYSLARHGQAVQWIETSELIHHAAHLLHARALVVAVSQSGRSAEIVRLLDAAAQCGAPVLGVTNTADSPLRQRSAAHILTHAGEEATVSCKTYVAALLALRWLAAALTGEDTAGLRGAVQPLAGALRAYLAHWPAHTAHLEARLAGVEHLFLVGRGASLAACGTGALITKESAHVHAEGMSCAALRHGPLEMLDKNCFVAVFAGDEPTRGLNRRLYEEVSQYGVPAAWIDYGSGADPFDLPGVPDGLRAIVEILPVEMMTQALAHLRGRRAGDFTRGGKITLTE